MLALCILLLYANYTFVVLTLSASRLQEPNPETALEHYFGQWLPGAPVPACTRVDRSDQHYGVEYTCYVSPQPLCRTGHVGIVAERVVHTYLNQCKFPVAWLLLSLDFACERGAVREGYYYETGISIRNELHFADECERVPVAFGNALWLLVKPEGRMWCPNGFRCEQPGYPNS